MTQSSNTVTATEVPITPAQLQNADGSYAQTTGAVVNDVFAYREGVWHKTAADESVEHWPHTVVVDEAVEATCTEPGLTQGSHCATCGKVLAEQEEVPMVEHTWSSEWNMDDTNHWRECEVCGEGDEHTAHTPGESRQENVQGATCTTPGSYDEVVCCSACGKELSRETKAGEKLPHQWSDWSETKATCVTKGERIRRCETCGETEIEESEIDPGNHANKVELAAVAATCYATGLEKGEKCADCGEILVSQKATPMIAHSYGKPEFAWAEMEGGYSAVAAYTCMAEGCTEETQDHVKTEPAEVTSETTPAQHTEDGRIIITGTVSFNGHGYTSEPIAIVLGAAGHKEAVMDAEAATCEKDGKTEGVCCTVCGEILEEQEVLPAIGHDWDEGMVTLEPGCETAGIKTYRCLNDHEHTYTEPIEPTGHSLIAVEGKRATCTKEGYSDHQLCEICEKEFGKEVIPAEGHTYGEPSFDWRQNDQGGWSAKAVFTCVSCGDQKEINAEVSVEDLAAATCTEAGSRQLTAAVTFEEEEHTNAKLVEIPAKGHTEVTLQAVAPTCTETGLTEGKGCAVCDEILVERETVEALGHNYELTWFWLEDHSGATLSLVCKNDSTHAGNAAAEVTSETTPATTQAEGKTVYTATAVYENVTYTDTKETVIDRLPSGSGGGSGGGGFVGGGSGGGAAGGEVIAPTQPEVVEVVEQETPLSEKPFVFEDVAETDWFYESVKYACAYDMMNGVSETHFSPMAVTSRGMIVTMLYRLEKEPETDLADFPDVVPGEWYTAAVAWGGPNGIVKGYDNGNFGPMDSITREQLAAFLFRYAQLKGYDVTGRDDLSAFVDAENVSAWALESVQWAVSEGLLKGTGSGLNALGTATRSEAATVLVRFVQTHAEEAK